MSILAEDLKRILEGARDMEIVEFVVDGEPVYLASQSTGSNGKGRATLRFSRTRPVWQG